VDCLSQNALRCDDVMSDDRHGGPPPAVMMPSHHYVLSWPPLPLSSNVPKSSCQDVGMVERPAGSFGHLMIGLMPIRLGMSSGRHTREKATHFATETAIMLVGTSSSPGALTYDKAPTTLRGGRMCKREWQYLSRSEEASF
jgi:hypothetical protein